MRNLGHLAVRLMERLSIDKAVFYALLARGWRAFGGLISIVLIGHHLSPVLQGYYFTFQSLIALQVFVELGLSVVIINVTSHEWSELGLDTSGRIIGNPDALSRLVSFARKLAVWYAVAAVLFIAIAGIGGTLFLSHGDNAVSWLLPWLSAVLLQAILLWTLPFQALIEGCNQIVSVQRFQLWQSIVANLALWTALVTGLGLWSVTVLLAAQVLAATYFLALRKHRFFEPFWVHPKGSLLDWRREVWPMQWKLALQGLVNYFMYSLYVPMIFYYHGPTQAGRFGMTWQVFSVIQTLSLAWVQTRVPRFGALVARRGFHEFDTLWKRTTVISLVVFSLCMAGFLLLVTLLVEQEYALANRFLEPKIALLLLPAGLLGVWVQCAAINWRAHKVEPLGISATIPALLNGALVWWWVRGHGAIGAIAANLVILLTISAPLALYLKRKVSYDYRSGI